MNDSTIFLQSAVIPYRIKNGELKLLLITSQNSKKWIIPKGIIEPGLTPQESAKVEALEEAGVSGKVFDEKIGEYEIRKWGGLCKIDVYLMQVEEISDKWLEQRTRKRRWVSILEAEKLIQLEALRNIIKNSVPEIQKKVNNKNL